ncbi:hypothetical protein AGR1C_pTi0134 [Agrobacterium fabacearum TT111]|nr:hypothetical protein AGR1C_pTi0134 [Agrobacterium fabacearum TT111]
MFKLAELFVGVIVAGKPVHEVDVIFGSFDHNIGQQRTSLEFVLISLLNFPAPVSLCLYVSVFRS